MELKNKKILITGASDGIGKATALRLAKENTYLILLGRDKEKLEQIKEECIKQGALETTTYAFDLADADDLETKAEKIKKQHKDINVLLNIAGIWQKTGELDTLTHTQIDYILNTNLNGLIKLTNTLLPNLRVQHEAAIINISSRSGYSAQSGQSVYTASKYGVKGFTEVLYQDLKDTNVRVAGVYQGGTNTQMFNKAGDIKTEEKLKTFIPTEELAEVIIFMLTRGNNCWLPEIKVENK
jgi:short-subunit dehydrogenase